MFDNSFKSKILRKNLKKAKSGEHVVMYNSRLERKISLGQVQQIIDCKGRGGQDGEQGVDGSNGMHGSPGIDSNHGEGGPASHGTGGTNGTNGNFATEGENGRPIHLILSGNTDSLNISGNYNWSVSLEGENVIGVDTSGGIGGRGGRGGKGGNGGDGGDGGRGGKGEKGRDGVSPGSDGNDGFEGFRGGRGGNGGEGGSGGNSGSSGNGGNGGNIVIQAEDPKLFMLFEVNCLGGKGGSVIPSGVGGRGGAGGKGGVGGEGGPGGNCGPSVEQVSPEGDRKMVFGNDGQRGSHGSQGQAGRSGYSGKNGRDGKRGKNGKNGCTMFAVASRNSKNKVIIKEQGPTRFELVCSNFSIKGIVDDGIFEPGEQVVISDIQVSNVGSISSPEGVKMFFPSSKFLRTQENAFLNLPSIKPGEGILLRYNVSGEIMHQEVSPQDNECLLIQTHHESRVSCIGRFFESGKKIVAFTIQYPVRIGKVIAPNQMGKEEMDTVVFDINNISTLAYGIESGNGEVSVRIILSRGLSFNQPTAPDFMLPDDEGYNDGVPDAPSLEELEYVPESMDIPLTQLKEMTSAQLRFQISMSDQVDYFAREFFRVELYYKHQIIESQKHEVRCCPSFIPVTPENHRMFDGLFVTNRHLSQRSFENFCLVFQGLGLNFNIWDIERYRGFSFDHITKRIHDVSWVKKFRNKIILTPLWKNNKFFFSDILPHHLLDHFLESRPEEEEEEGDDIKGWPDREIEIPSQKGKGDGKLKMNVRVRRFDSGFVVYNGPEDDKMNMFRDVCYQSQGTQKILIECPTTGLWNYYIISSPKESELRELAKGYIATLRTFVPSKSFKVFNTDFKPKKTGWFSHDLGTSKLQVLPLTKTDRFIFVQKNSHLDQNVRVSGEKEIFIYDFFVAVKSIICSLGLEKKIGMFKREGLARLFDWKFLMPGGELWDLDDVLGDCVYEDLRNNSLFVDLKFSKFQDLLSLVSRDLEYWRAEERRKEVLISSCYRVYWDLKQELGWFDGRKKECWKLISEIEKTLQISRWNKSKLYDAAKLVNHYEVFMYPLQCKE